MRLNSYKFLNILIAIVWIINGLFCKVLNFIPRHAEIVQSILDIDTKTASILTIIIGLSEILMAIWILTGLKSKLNVITQIIIVATMNVLEFMLAPDSLLWGKFNILFALLFIVIVYVNEFINHKKNNHAFIS